MSSRLTGTEVVLACVVAVFALLIVLGTAQLKELRKEAIELGYAQHNAVTGKWEWRKDNENE